MIRYYCISAKQAYERCLSKYDKGEFINKKITEEYSKGNTYVILDIAISADWEQYLRSQGYNILIKKAVYYHITVISWDLYKEKEVLS